MPFRSHNPLEIPRATRSGRNVRQRAIFCPDASPDRASGVSAGQSVARSVQPSTAVQTSKSAGRVRRESNEVEEVEAGVESSGEENGSDSESSASADSVNDSELELDADDLNEVKGAWEGQSKKSLYRRMLLEKGEKRVNAKRVAELEKEVKSLKKAVGDDGKTRKQLVDLRHTYLNAKNDLEHTRIKASALRKEVAELKKNASNGAGSDAVATLQLQHQKALFDASFKLKNVEIDLAVAVKQRKEAETELVVARKTVEKLRGKIDDIAVDSIKAGKTIGTLVEKARVKRKTVADKFSNSDAVIDRAIQKKGNGISKRGRKGRNHHVSREEEAEAMRSFGKWKGKKGRQIDYSDDSDSSSDSSSSSGGYARRRRKRRRSREHSRGKRTSRSSRRHTKKRHRHRHQASSSSSSASSSSSSASSSSSSSVSAPHHQHRHQRNTHIVLSQYDSPTVHNDCVADTTVVDSEICSRLSQQSIGADSVQH